MGSSLSSSVASAASAATSLTVTAAAAAATPSSSSSSMPSSSILSPLPSSSSSSSSIYSLSRTWYVEKLKALREAPSGALTLVFADGEPVTFALHDAFSRSHFVASLLWLMNTVLGFVPDAPPQLLALLPDNGRGDGGGDARTERGGGGNTTGEADGSGVADELADAVEQQVRAVSLSDLLPAEREQLEAVLGESMAADKIEDVEAALAAEIEALEAANVEALLALGPEIDVAMAAINGVLDEAEVLEATLASYAGIVDGMASQLEVIQETSTATQVLTTNHRALLLESNALLNSLRVSKRTRTALTATKLSELDALPGIEAALGELEKPPSFGPQSELVTLTAVHDHEREVAALKAKFAARLAGYEAKLATALHSDPALVVLRSGFFDFPSRRPVYAGLLPYAPLTKWLARTDPVQRETLARAYLTRARETLGAVAPRLMRELRRAVAQVKLATDMSALPNDPVGELTVRGHGSSSMSSSSRGSEASFDVASTARSASSFGGGGSERLRGTEALFRAVNAVVDAVVAEARFLDTWLGESSDAQLENWLEVAFGNVLPHVDKLAIHVNGLNAFDTVTYLAFLASYPADDEFPRAHSFLAQVLTLLQNAPNLAFSQYVDRQVRKIGKVKVAARRCGILWPCAKFASFFVQIGRALFGTELGARGGAAREVVELALTKVALAVFETLERVAASDAKYAHLVLYENYHHFYITTEAAMEQLPQLRALGKYVAEAREAYLQHRAAYVTDAIEYQLGDFVRFFNAIGGLLDSISAQEVAFQDAYSKLKFDKLMSKYGTPKQVERNLLAMRKRVIKHVAGDKEGLYSVVWERILLAIQDLFARCDATIRAVYGDDKATLGAALSAALPLPA
ncbi:uncharacterized protein AMSG_04555 [Thecamonas trahens ATCC 50062]|uniref:Exocyst complex component Sec3 C-terminal domain-containing protein n=1 Tax=Thecamonas trahens ATCC 50062 TaxID=461836 RepID=A0A0L0D7J3_THETB|nr:hypothetical protein AMSG_04555 [Thecamonas trahens ATCC 50062]KNC48324.1 hypothetical protein AMSG_04555 [Thecamonas trahens ATCC 50062]|eukprot:XP_013758891.1 hypothetical protein AMSG_04555 [Thecamonas trahens ATCC 50062]